MAHLTRLVLALAVVAFAASCGTDTTDVTSNGTTDPAPTAPDTSRPSDASPFLSIDVSGGFGPAGYDFKSLPSATVYDDGTVFAPAAQPAIYPGPALSTVTTGQISTDDMARIVAAATEVGLTSAAPADFGDTMIADAPTTTITIVVDGQTYTTAVYALHDSGLRPGIGDSPDDPGAVGATGARAEIAEFVTFVDSIVIDAATGTYEPERYRVLPIAAGDGPVAEGITPDEQEWPFPAIDLDEFECTVIEGDDATALRDALAGANELTRWQTEGSAAYTLNARAVLPHEPGCPDT